MHGSPDSWKPQNDLPAWLERELSKRSNGELANWFVPQSSLLIDPLSVGSIVIGAGITTGVLGPVGLEEEWRILLHSLLPFSGPDRTKVTQTAAFESERCRLERR